MSKQPLYPHVPKGSTPRAKFLGWLDTGVIADAIIEDLEEQGVEATFDNIEKVWLAFLETEMPDGLRKTISYTLT